MLFALNLTLLHEEHLRASTLSTLSKAREELRTKRQKKGNNLNGSVGLEGGDWEQQVESIWAESATRSEELVRNYRCGRLDLLDVDTMAPQGSSIPADLALVLSADERAELGRFEDHLHEALIFARNQHMAQRIGQLVTLYPHIPFLFALGAGMFYLIPHCLPSSKLKFKIHKHSPKGSLKFFLSWFIFLN